MAYVNYSIYGSVTHPRFAKQSEANIDSAHNRKLVADAALAVVATLEVRKFYIHDSYINEKEWTIALLNIEEQSTYRVK